MEGNMIFLEKFCKKSLCVTLLLMISLKLASAQASSFQEILVDVGYAKFLTHVWNCLLYTSDAADE